MNNPAHSRARKQAKKLASKQAGEPAGKQAGRLGGARVCARANPYTMHTVTQKCKGFPCKPEWRHAKCNDLHANRKCREAATRMAKPHDFRAIRAHEHGVQVRQRVVSNKNSQLCTLASMRALRHEGAWGHRGEEQNIHRRPDVQAGSSPKAAAGGTRTNDRKRARRHPYKKH